MNKRKPRPCRRNTSPLSTPLADRLNPGALSMLIPPSAPPQSPRMPSPSRSTRDVVTLLSALTGLSLAARPDAEVELLPGSPTTVLVVSGGKARATFVLPVSRDQVSRALGRPHAPVVDPELDRLWMEEQRQDEMLPSDLLLKGAV